MSDSGSYDRSRSEENEPPKVQPPMNVWNVMPTNAYTTASFAANYAAQAFQSAAAAGAIDSEMSSALINQTQAAVKLNYNNSPNNGGNTLGNNSAIAKPAQEVSALSFLNVAKLENRPTFAFQNPYTQASTSQAPKQQNDSSQSSIANNQFNRDGSTDVFGRNIPKTDSEHKRQEFQRRNDRRDRNDRNDVEEENGCVKISNMCSSTSYSDIRRFFSGLYIPNNGIKMINDDRGMRTGTAYIRFVRALNVPKALVRDGTMFKNNKIALEAVSDEDFKNAVDSYKPSRSRFNNNDNRGSNNDNSRRMDSRWDDRGRDDSAPRDERSRFNDKPFSVLLVKDVPSHATQLDVMKLFSSYTILDILLTHRPGNRRDTIAYIKFHRAEEAQMAYEEQTKHRINQRQVRIAIASDSDYEQAKEQMRLENEEQIRLQKELEERENREGVVTDGKAKAPMVDSDDRDDCEQENDQDQEDERIHEDDRDSQSFNIDEENNFNNEPDNMDQNSSNSKSSSRLNGIPSLLDIPASLDNAGDKVPDPRLRQGRPSRFDNPPSNNMNNMNNINNNNNSNQMTPAHDNFILIKNCEYRISIQTVGEFFVAHNLMPNHVEMLRNNRNQPRGEFIIELQNGKDAEKALRLNNIRLNSRPLRVCPISPQQIADILNKPFMNFFPGGGANNNNMMMARMMMMQNQGQRNNFNNLGGGGNYNNNNGNNRGYGNDRNMLDDDDQMQFGGPRGGNGGGGGGNGPMNNRKMNPFNNIPSNSNMFDDSNQQQQQQQSSKQQNQQQHQRQSEVIDLDNESVEGDDGNNDGDIDGGAEEEDIADRDEGNAEIDADPDADADADADADVDADDGDGDGIPEKFTLPGCVVEMENVPYRCGLKDIMDFFDGFNVLAEDIIRRYNDDGSPTGDARVAFRTPEDAKLAYEQKRQKSIMNRTIFLNVL